MSAQPLPVPERPIPGPKGWPKWKALRRLSKEPHKILLELATTYGDIAMLDFPGERVVFLFKPEYIEHVLHKSYRNYVKQTGRWRSLRQIWGHGLITSDGEFWRRQRQRMQPAFHQDRIDAYMDVFADEASHAITLWEQAAASGTPRDVYRDMMSCSVRALTRAMFGAEVEGKTDAIYRALTEIHPYVNPASLVSFLDPPKVIRRLITPGYRRFEHGLAQVQAILDDIVRRRRTSESNSRDLLSMIMLGVDDEKSEAMGLAELHDEMMVILMAGHETVGIAVGWAWYWLARMPDVERRLHEEVDRVLGDRLPTVADLPQLTYTRMIVEEVLRICPPIYAFDRRAVADEVIDGYRIPEGATLGLSPYAMHHNPKYWERPEEFNPDRFSPAQSEGRPDYAFFPFGGGPRRCIGFRFASIQAVALLAVLSRRFELRARAEHPVTQLPRLNLSPAPGIVMAITRRTEARAARSSPA